MRKYGNTGISMREIAEVAGITTQTLLNNVRLLEPYFEFLEEQMEQQKKPPMWRDHRRTNFIRKDAED